MSNCWAKATLMSSKRHLNYKKNFFLQLRERKKITRLDIVRYWSYLHNNNIIFNSQKKKIQYIRISHIFWYSGRTKWLALSWKIKTLDTKVDYPLVTSLHTASKDERLETILLISGETLCGTRPRAMISRFVCWLYHAIGNWCVTDCPHVLCLLIRMLSKKWRCYQIHPKLRSLSNYIFFLNYVLQVPNFSLKINNWPHRLDANFYN